MMKFIEAYREYIVLFFVLPSSFVLCIYEVVKRWVTAPAPSGHDARVRRVCAEVKQRGTAGGLMTTDRSSASSLSVRLTKKSHRTRIAMSDLRAILSLDVHSDGEGATVRVEPGLQQWIAALAKISSLVAPPR